MPGAMSGHGGETLPESRRGPYAASKRWRPEDRRYETLPAG